MPPSESALPMIMISSGCAHTARSRKRLADIALIFMDGDMVVIPVTQCAVIASIGKVEEEKLLTVEHLLNIGSLVDADHDFFIWRSGPLVGFFLLASRRDINIFPVPMGELLPQCFQRLSQFGSFILIFPDVQRPAAVIVIDHLPRHPAVNADILACDKACLL